MENSLNYSFSLRVDQVEFSVGGDKEFVETNMKKWLALFKDKLPSELVSGDRSEIHHAEQQPHQSTTRSKTSIGDFIKLKAPKSFSDFFITVLFYHERYEGMENTGVPIKQVIDFVARFPNHPSDQEVEGIVSQLVSDGFIQMMDGSENYPRYQVTFSGEQLVKQGFS